MPILRQNSANLTTALYQIQNPMTDFILELLKISIPAVAVLVTAWLLLSNMLDNSVKMRQLELAQQRLQFNSKRAQDTLPVRLQAYERLSLYLERMHPQALIQRTREENMTAPEMQMALITTIRTEFEYNITQQIYVSSEVWAMIRGATEEMISIINQLSVKLPTEASGTDLSLAFLRYFLTESGVLPTQKALDQLNEEAKLLFSV
ncbi:hypothetical protein C7N43_18360 [Sphingobacteriales bacterium UPWRP_1]|nr:hypothetical protein BVG80_03140 [Sphingobacteriales bacterium TSM_CSM]PSJ75533.1 hypothetical protein C7N43_18360 [Sphingobacteriales bacterium UPWRP_1]